MTTLAQLRKAALSLPATDEHRTDVGETTFTVHGERFAAKSPDGFVRLHLPAAEADQVRAAHPTAEPLGPAEAPIGVRVPLRDIDGQQLNHWVRRAWLSRAPERLAARVTAAETAVPGEVGDLPKAIGRPATQALVNAGISTLDQVAELTEAELLAMHGVGPKAVRLLDEALSVTGRTFRR